MSSNRPVRVAMTSEVYYPDLPGGLLQFFRYGPGLKERGVTFHMHTKMEPDHEEPELEVNGVWITRHKLPAGLSHHAEREILLERAIADLETRRDKEDVCVQPCSVTRPSLSLIRRARKSGIGFIMSFTMFPDDPPRNLYRRIRNRLSFKMLVAPFDCFLTCSQSMKKAFHKAGIAMHKMEVLRNGIDLDFYKPGDQDKDGLTVFYSGSITRRKGSDLLLKAWPDVLAEHPKAKLLIAGSFGQRKSFRDPKMRADLDAFTGECRLLLKNMPDRDSVVLLGNLDSVVEYYQKADVFVFPSLLEGLPNSVLEAMSCGLPCVLSPFRGIPGNGEEFGRDNVDFVRTTHQPADIAREINALLSDKERREEMGRNARKWIVESQAVSATLDHLETVYRRIAG